jgi:hypothetical protein
MEKEIVKKVLLKNTASIFNPEWYEKVSSEIVNSHQEKNVGYVYFAKPIKSDFVKIGMSLNVTERVKSLQHQFGKMNLLGFIYTENYKAFEKEAHEYFKQNNISGEWFELDIRHIQNFIEKNLGVFLNKSISECLIDQGCVLNKETNFDKVVYGIISNIPLNTKFTLNEFKDLFLKTKIKPNKIISVAQSVANLNNLILTKPRSNGVRYVMITKNTNVDSMPKTKFDS